MIAPWVKGIVETVLGESKMRVGEIMTHPDGRSVKIVSGQYWGAHGVSNFWSWREVRANGELGEIESGYGW